MNPPPKLPLPPVLEAKLAAFRRRVWIIKLAEGLLAALFGLALSFLIVFVLDRFMETPAWLRTMLMLSSAAVLGLGLPLKWHRWVWQQRRLEDAARLLRHTFPRLGDQLLGIVELAHQDAGTGRSERLVQAAMNQAADAVKDVSLDNAVPQDSHRRWAWTAGIACAVAVTAFALVPGAAWNALGRWLTPWREIDRYTFAKIEALPNKLVVPYAEPVEVGAILRTDTEWAPASGTARVQDQPKIVVKEEHATYAFKLPPQKKNAPLNLSIGDVRKSIALVPTPRPEMKKLQAQLTLPDYLGYQTQPVLEARNGSVSVLKDAQVSFELSASRALATARMDSKPQPIVQGAMKSLPIPVAANAEYRFDWEDADRLAAREPLTLKVTAVDDEQPRIFARRDSQEQVIIESEVVTLDLEASDDFGIQRVGLLWKGVVGESSLPTAKGESISAAGGNELRNLTAKATFCAQRDGVPPQSIELRAWAEDYKTGHRALSPGIVLHILSKDDHALWMTEQFGKWLQAARESYEQEQRLHETNRELRALKAEELGRPENRRKLTQQANAESANSDRLERLNDAGKKMIEQAARNDAFDAQRLEQWAQTLKQLKDIADKKMPSVADLLKKSSSAQGQSSEQSGEPQKPSPSSDSKDAPKVSQGEQSKGDSKPQAMDPNAQDQPKAPSVADNEKSFFEQKPSDDSKSGDPKKPGSGKLGLPNTTLDSPAEKPNTKPRQAQSDSPAQKELNKAIDEQKELLTAFAKVTDQLSNLLAGMEGSTFVKRLKAASKKQMGIASTLNATTLQAFGLDKKRVAQSEVQKSNEVAVQQTEASTVVRVIQSDLDAYYQRKQDTRFKNILDQMKKTEVVAALSRIGDEVRSNWSGRGIAASEYWADMLDRWAEEMVAAAQAGESKESKPQDSLPPEVVLKVMQVLFDEMKLRDETREAEAARPALDKKDYFKRATGLALKQDDIGRRTAEAVAEISKLPKAESFQKEMKLLMKVTEVMKDAYVILDKPETGPTAIAAETEAIELLLEARRQPPGGGGGGGGSNPGGGGGAASASSSALANIGPGSDASGMIGERAAGQATGKAGRELPEEFKTGLDAYFNTLEAGKK